MSKTEPTTPATATALPGAVGTRPRPRRGKPTPAHSIAITRAILAAATELFLRHGFDGTTLEAVAQQAGVPKRTLYKRFPDKAQLLNAVLATRVSAWSSVTSRQNAALGTDLRERLQRHVATMLVWATSAEVRAFTRLFASAYALSGDNSPRQQFNGHAEMIELIAHDIAQYGPAQGIHAADPVRASRLIMALLSGWLDLRPEADPICAVEADQQAELLLDALLRGADAW